MGKSKINWQGALEGLSGGLGQLAGYYKQREDMEWQNQREAADRAFKERMQDLAQKNAESLQKSNQEFLKEGQEDKQAHDLILFDKESALKTSQFAAQLKMDEKRLGLGYAQLAQAGNSEAARAKREALGLFVSMEGAQYKGITEQLSKELEALDKNQLYLADPKAKEAAKADIEARYAPKINEASDRYNKALNTVLDESGSDFRVGDHEAVRFGTEEGKAEFKNIAMDLVNQAVESGKPLNRNDIAFNIQKQYGLTGKDLLEATNIVMQQYRAKQPAGGSGSW